MRPWVLIKGGLVQDRSPDVLVIDVDVSDFPNSQDVRYHEQTVSLARRAGLPEHVILAAEDAVSEARNTIEAWS